MQKKKPVIRDLEAFCGTCPPASLVTIHLQALGFRLVFQMDEWVPAESADIPALPPQYHYMDEQGTEIVYLAGQDIPMEGESYPAHASRFWLWPGADPGAYQRALSLLFTAYRIFWQAPLHARKRIA